MKINKKSNPISDEKIIAVIFIVMIFSSLFLTIISNHDVIVDKIKTIWNQGDLNNYKKISQIANQSETIFNEVIYQKTSYINTYGLVQRVLQKRYIEDSNDKSREVYKTQDKMLTFIQKEENMEKRANSIYNYYEILKEQEIPVIYIQAPYKVKSENQLPIGVVDYANKNADKLLENLNKKGVYTIDLREYFKDMDIKEEYFITDHHWKIETAFKSVNYITEILNNQYEFHIDQYYSHINNYKLINLKESFLGSIGKRVGKYYSTIDDFEYIVPNFETNLEVTKGEEVKKGNFEETVIIKELIENEDIETNRYACYFGGDFPEIILNNNNILNNKKVLVIQDSYGLAFSSLLSLRVKELRTIDLRHFEGNEIEYTKQYNPDIVIILYNPSSFYIENNFIFE